MTIARRPIASIEQVEGLRVLLDKKALRRSIEPRPLRADPVAMFDADEAWVGGEGSTTEPYVGFGKRARRIEATAGATVVANCALPAPWVWDFVTYPQMEALIYVDVPANLSTITFFHATSSAVSKYFQFAATGATLKPGWNLVRALKASVTPMGGAVDADWSNINHLRMRVIAASGQTVNVYVASWRAVKPQGIILLDHDDGHITNRAAWEIEEKYGLRSTAYVNPGLLGTADRLTWGDLWDAHIRGHDIASHGWDHVRLSTLDDEGKRASIRKAYNSLIGHGFTRAARFFAAPNGETSGTIPTIVAEYHLMNRSGLLPVSGSVYPPRTTDFTGGHAYLSFATDTASSAAGYVDAIVANGTMGHLTTHIISDDSATYGDVLRISLAEYDVLCSHVASHVAAGDVLCLTMSEYWDVCHPAVVLSEAAAHRLVISPTTGALSAERTV